MVVKLDIRAAQMRGPENAKPVIITASKARGARQLADGVIGSRPEGLPRAQSGGGCALVMSLGFLPDRVRAGSRIRHRFTTYWRHLAEERFDRQALPRFQIVGYRGGPSPRLGRPSAHDANTPCNVACGKPSASRRNYPGESFATDQRRQTQLRMAIIERIMRMA